MDKREKMLGSTPIGKLFITLSIPAITGMIVQALYNVVDRYFIGNIPEVGEIAIGGVGVTLPILFILMGFSMLFGIGSAANISLKLGQKDTDGAEKILANGFIMLGASAVLILIIFTLGMDSLLKLYGATKANFGYAKSYFQIILVGNLWNSYAFGLNHIIRSEGNSKRAMYSMLIGAGTNIVLDALFIRVFNMGVEGAAYATIIAQFLSFLWGISYYLKGRSTVKLHRSNVKINRKLVFQIMAIGFSPFFMQIAGSLIGGLINNGLKEYGGDLAQGAYAVVGSLSMLFLMPVFGMNQALQPMIGFNYGAKNYERVKKSVFVGIASAFTVLAVATVLMFAFTEEVVRVMAPSPNLIAVTTPAVRYVFATVSLASFQIIGSTLFQSIGKAKIAFVMSMSRQVLALIPLIIILPKFMGLNGIWLSIPLADGISFVLAIFLLKRELKRMNALTEDTANTVYAGV